MSPEKAAMTLVALKKPTTACELAEALDGYSETACRNWLNKLADMGICKVRHRPHVKQGDGRKTSGHLPREYVLAKPSEWGNL